jgi:Domain of Unknown Function (DUF928)
MKKTFSPNQHKISKLIPSLALALSLLFATTAIAAYKPPANPSRPKTATGSNSSRSNGCTGNAKTSLTALAPIAYVGQTVSLQPTFAWFVPENQNRDIEFSLYEYTTNGKSKLLYRVQQQSTGGIMKVSLPAEKASLSVGNRYWWQVALLCNPKHPSEDLLVKAEIEVVAAPSDLKNALSSIKEPLKPANLYAEKGFWYDALTELLNNPANNIEGFKLLEELRKSEIEAANKISDTQSQKNVQQQVQRLQEILDAGKGQ